MIYLAAVLRTACPKTLRTLLAVNGLPPPCLIVDPALWLHPKTVNPELISYSLSSSGLSPSRVLPANTLGNRA